MEWENEMGKFKLEGNSVFFTPVAVAKWITIDISIKQDINRDMDFSEDINSEYLLNKYGPEGLYDIAELLIKRANQDISDSYEN